MKLKILLIFGLGFSVNLMAKSMFVFVPTEVRTKVIQDKIGSFCSGTDVTVFGRAKDFHKQVKANPPNVILSLSPVVNASASYIKAMDGQKDGSSKEKYVLVSVDTPMDVSVIGTKKIGVVDLLGRKPMTSFISDLFKTKLKLKRVTKVEDLLPLIAFGSANGLFVSESIFLKLKEKSNLNLVSVSLDIEIGRSMVAIKQPSDKDVAKCVSSFDDSLNTTLGVDKWLSL